jgi:hypothetical protein
VVTEDQAKDCRPEFPAEEEGPDVVGGGPTKCVCSAHFGGDSLVVGRIEGYGWLSGCSHRGCVEKDILEVIDRVGVARDSLDAMLFKRRKKEQTRSKDSFLGSARSAQKKRSKYVPTLNSTRSRLKTARHRFALLIALHKSPRALGL